MGAIPNGRQSSEDWIPQPTTGDEHISQQPFPAPQAVSVPSHCERIIDTIVDNDESWVSFDTTILSEPPTALWDESPGSAAGFSDGLQQTIISSSLPGHPSPTISPHSGQKLSFYKVRISHALHQGAVS